MMARAIDLARLNYGLTGKNPSVGCVICVAGFVIAEAATSVGGNHHAEELAFNKCTLPLPERSTVYVTLEPCRNRSSESLKSCSDWIIDAKPERVVVSVQDSHLTAAGGIEKIKVAGITVEVGLKSSQAVQLYQSFFDQITVQENDPA